jgi:hypothetical protein
MNSEDESAAIGAAAGAAAAAAAAVAGPARAPAKAGWRTSELWVTLGLPVLLQLLTVASHVPGPWGALAGAVGSGLYSLSRGMAKTGR